MTVLLLYRLRMRSLIFGYIAFFYMKINCVILENQEEAENRRKKFKILESKKNALEVKLSEKCFELKKLCIAEAELTGTIPLEIPLDPDESPPKIRRRIGTMVPFTDDTISQLNQV